MSPEQIAGKKVDGRSDLYSLGVMLFQMLAGVLPFRGDSMAELMYKIANEAAPDIRIIRPELPEKLANMVALSISKRPEARYQNGDQFAADLRAIMSDLTGLANSASTAPLAGVQTKTHADPAGFDSTVVQSATVYEATQTTQAETSAFDKTIVSDSRGTEPQNLSISTTPKATS